jgi:Zn-dependent protease with chaperone function
LAYSRYQEHEADQFALDLTHANHSGALSFVTLQQENLSNPRPGLFYKCFRSTHPSIGDRIDFCNAYHPWRSDGPPESEMGHEKSPISALQEDRDPHNMMR